MFKSKSLVMKFNLPKKLFRTHTSSMLGMADSCQTAR